MVIIINMESVNNNDAKVGRIYIIQAPDNNYIKIGLTTTNDKKLIERYATYYGSEMTIYLFTSNNIVVHEAQIHRSLKDAHKSMERFNVDALERALELLTVITGSIVKVVNYFAPRREFSETIMGSGAAINKPPAEYKFAIKKINCGLLVKSAEITGDVFDDLLINYVSRRKHEMNKYLVREIYNWRDEIRADFGDIYSRLGVIVIFMNVGFVNNGWKESIIRAREYYIGRGLDVLAFRFSIAANILLALGFDGFNDDKIISKAELTLILDVIGADITGNWAIINRAFPEVIGIGSKWTFAAALKYVNILIEGVFGCRLEAAGHMYWLNGRVYGTLLNLIGSGRQAGGKW